MRRQSAFTITPSHVGPDPFRHLPGQVSVASVNHNLLHPGPRSQACHAQIEPVPVAVDTPELAARVESHGGDRKLHPRHFAADFVPWVCRHGGSRNSHSTALHGRLRPVGVPSRWEPEVSITPFVCAPLRPDPLPAPHSAHQFEFRRLLGELHPRPRQPGVDRTRAHYNAAVPYPLRPCLTRMTIRRTARDIAAHRTISLRCS